MKKRPTKQSLKECGWIYLFFAVVAVILAVVFACIKLPKEVLDIVPKNLDDIKPRDYIVGTLAASALIDFWYYWLAKRFVKGKSNGTFFMVLLIIGVVGNAIGLIINPAGSTLNLCIDAVTLYFVLKLRKEEK